MKDRLIDKNSSLIIKGGAILLMLIHHLFYNVERLSMWDDFHLEVLGHNFGIVNQFGIWGKLCVSLFVFISGYGLSTSYLNRRLQLKPYFIRRFIKLYLNYWFVALIFTSISTLVFNRSYISTYGEHYLIKGILDLFGIISMFGYTGYNPTWWFYSCIILLYILFPIINKYIDCCLLFLVSISFPLSFCVCKPVVCSISLYLLPFVVGVKMARMSVLSISNSPLLINFASFLILALIRNFCANFIFIVDTLLCVYIAIILYQWQFKGIIRKTFIFLGKHSMNIFLFHTFIYHFWFQNFIYSSRNPFVIFTILLIVCIVISVLIEKLKGFIGFNKLIAVINESYK